MGNIKTTFVKSAAQRLYDGHKEDFTNDFAKNKDVVKRFAEIKSKKLMNMIVGYVTTLKNREAA